MHLIYFVVTPDDVILRLAYDEAYSLAEEMAGAVLVPAEVTPDQYLTIAAWQPPPSMSVA